MRGRVMSVILMFINSSNELGQFESGMAAKFIGVVLFRSFWGMYDAAGGFGYFN